MAMSKSMTPDLTVQCEDDISKAARKRGRAYRCHRCYHSDGKNYIEVKCRMEAHILRDHLRRDEVPHFCSLCQFRCLRREDLEDHLVKYRRHRVLAQQSGVDPDDTTCLKSNTSPYIIDEKDFSVMDREASFQHWKKILENRKRAQDPLSKAVNEIFPDGIPADFDFQDEEEEEPLPSLNSKPHPQMVVSLDGHTLKATLTPLLEKLSTVVDQQTLKSLLGDQGKEQGARIEVLPEEKKAEAEKQEETTTTTQHETVVTHMETVREREEENLMPQLLPKEDQVLTPKRKRAGTLIPNKRMRSESPSSRSESTYDSGPESSDDEDTELKKELIKEMKSTREAVQRNTRVLQSLEESILTLASAMTAVAKANGKITTGEIQTGKDDKQQTIKADKSGEVDKQTLMTHNQHSGQTDNKDRKDRKREHSRERRGERYNERKHERYDRDRKDEKQNRSHSDSRRDRHYRR